MSQGNGRGKASDGPKPAASKKAKANNGHSMQEPEEEEQEELDMSKDEYNANGKKMTDEEKRKNFLERNRYVLFKQSTSFSKCLLTWGKGLPRSNVDSAKSNGSQIYKQKLRCTVARTTTLALRYLNSEMRLSISKLFFLLTRIVQ